MTASVSAATSPALERPLGIAAGAGLGAAAGAVVAAGASLATGRMLAPALKVARLGALLGAAGGIAVALEPTWREGDGRIGHTLQRAAQASVITSASLAVLAAGILPHLAPTSRLAAAFEFGMVGALVGGLAGAGIGISESR